MMRYKSHVAKKRQKHRKKRQKMTQAVVGVPSEEGSSISHKGSVSGGSSVEVSKKDSKAFPVHEPSKQPWLS
jgi:hypothetical protein